VLNLKNLSLFERPILRRTDLLWRLSICPHFDGDRKHVQGIGRAYKHFLLSLSLGLSFDFSSPLSPLSPQAECWFWDHTWEHTSGDLDRPYGCVRTGGESEKGERMCVCVSERECVLVCVWERENVYFREKEREREFAKKREEKKKIMTAKESGDSCRNGVDAR